MTENHEEPERHVRITGSGALKAGDAIVIGIGLVVEGPSEVTIDKEGEPHTYQFGSGLASGEIVSASLAQENLSDVTPPYIQKILILNIDQIEKFIRDSEGKETVDEHSFKINLGIFSYEFKRKLKKN